MFQGELTGKTRHRADRKGRFILQAEYEFTHTYYCGQVEVENCKGWCDVTAEIYTMLNPVSHA